MYKAIIKNYIKKLSLTDVLNFASKNQINLTNEEASILLNYIKTDYETIIYGNSSIIFENLENKFDTIKLNKIKQLYFNFKEKYKNYL